MKTIYVILILLAIGLTANAQKEELDLKSQEIITKTNEGEINEPKVYSFVEQMPEYPGGDAVLNTYIQDHIIYPFAEKEEGIQGRVFLKFIINEDGSVGNIEITRSLSPGLNAEAIRIVKSLPNFIPGKFSDGTPVKVFYNLAIQFTIRDNMPVQAHTQAEEDSVKEMVSGKVYTFVETMPEYPGGDEALVKYVQTHIVYPEKEKKENIHGRVILRFVIEQDGTVGDINVSRSLSPGFDEEAVRVIRTLPNFTPGKQNGKPVAVYYNIPVSF